MCRMCGERRESVNHPTSECSNACVNIRGATTTLQCMCIGNCMCGKAELERTDKWYKHTPERVVENEGFKVLWDYFNVQCDRMVEARRPDIVFVDKQAREAKIIDMTIPGDARVKNRELEKIVKTNFLGNK